MSRITERDELMLSWLGVVRLADLSAIRLALTAFGDGADVIGLRRTQRWVLRMVRAGLLDRTIPGWPGGPVHWVTFGYAGHRAPNPFQQTARHSVAIATVSAHYLLRGWSWTRDEAEWSQYIGDGVAQRQAARVLVEVELTQKTSSRYAGILGSHARRLAEGEFDGVAYFGPSSVMRAVGREIRGRVFRDQVHLMTVHPVLDQFGRWLDDSGQSHSHLATGRVKSLAKRAPVEAVDGKH